MDLIGCESYCPHGGQCMKDAGHAGKHRSALDDNDPTACEWTDAESITRRRADMRLATKSPAGLRAVIEQRIAEMVTRRRRRG